MRVKSLFFLAALAAACVVIFIFTKIQSKENIRKSNSEISGRNSDGWRQENDLRKASSPITSIHGAGGENKKGSQIYRDFTPREALDEAYALAKCAFQNISSDNYPSDLTKEQQRQLEASRQDLVCSATPKYQIYDLVEYAAANGETQAQLDFPGLAALTFNQEQAALSPELIRKYKADSLKYLKLAARAGSPDALARLSESYQSGLFNDKSDVMSYAYAFAYSQVRNTELSRLRLRQLETKLPAADMVEAQRLGLLIVNNQGRGNK